MLVRLSKTAMTAHCMLKKRMINESPLIYPSPGLLCTKPAQASAPNVKGTDVDCLQRDLLASVPEDVWRNLLLSLTPLELALLRYASAGLWVPSPWGKTYLN